MLSNSTAHNDATAGQAGTIVVLIDESIEMAAPIAGGTKSKVESVATAVNSMLNQLTAGPDVRLAIVGYGGTTDGAPATQIRWSGPLSGRVLVSSSELAAAPARVEQRVRRIPGVGGVGIAREETIQFPIWYVPAESGAGGFEEAADFVGRMLTEAGTDSSGKPSLVIHLCGKLPIAAELQVERLRTALDNSICCHLHLGASDRVPATLFPSSSQHLPSEDVVALFEASSVLADPLAATLRSAQVAVTPGARGLVHQGGMGDLIRFLMLAKGYASSGAEAFASPGIAQTTTTIKPATVRILPMFPEAEATRPTSPTLPTCDRVALIVLADRSQADPESGVWLRRQEQVNDMIGRVAKRAGGDVDVGLIVYGGGTVETGLSGSLQGKTLVADVDLTDGALRVEHVTEKVSNGIGGLIELKRVRPIFVDCEAGEPAPDLAPAVAALIELIETVRDASEGKQVLPLVMHVTAGGLSSEAIARWAARLTELGNVLVYHSIVPEIPQRTVAYPDTVEQIADSSAAAFWQISSPLVGAEAIRAKRPAIGDTARGLVVGAKFDLLLASIEAILGRES